MRKEKENEKEMRIRISFLLRILMRLSLKP